jgi:putative SOS response-associated peptidase YedK
MGLLRWGLIPPWAKDPAMGSRMINARAETVSQKPAFRGAFRRRRCLVPADGFFEWKREGAEGPSKGLKTPYWIHLAGREPFVMAGLWEKWEPGDTVPLYTFTILTTEAVPTIREIHPRMPVILPEGVRDRWLDPSAAPEDILPLLRPHGDDIEAYPVSTLVNSPRNDLPECIEPA